MKTLPELNEEFLFEVGECQDSNAVVLPAEGSSMPQFYPPEERRSTLPWDPRLVLDLAIGIDALPDILLRYGLSEEVFNTLSDTPAFRRELAVAIRDQRENGVTFSSRAKVQAESYLEVIDGMVYGEGVPASVRLEAIKSVVRWGKLEPKDEKGDNQNNTQVIVNIKM